jgi:SAM-dependent methyltransferase
MRNVAAVIACVACTPAPVAPTPPPDIKAASHAIIDAFDKGQVAAIEPQLAPGFVRSEVGTPRDRGHVLEQLRKWTPDSPHIASRTWSNEHVLATGSEAVFVGDAAERSAGTRGGYTFDGRYTLAWHFEDGAWKLALWTWTHADTAGDREVWNDIFKHGTGFEKAPNQFLVDTVGKLSPGTALDIASGQGRNVLYLAEHGWKATGIDFSHEGMEQARATAKAKGVTVDLVEADMETTDFGTAKYDLVSMIYAGSDAPVISKIQAALKPGGVFVFEYFSSATPGKDGPTPGELAKLFAGYEILHDEVVDGVPDWAVDHAKLQKFVARKR